MIYVINFAVRNEISSFLKKSVCPKIFMSSMNSQKKTRIGSEWGDCKRRAPAYFLPQFTSSPSLLPPLVYVFLSKSRAFAKPPLFLSFRLSEGEGI